jgi:hypothetical protein
MNRIALACLLFACNITLPMQAQQHTAAAQEVLTIIDRFFGYMAARDTAGMANVLEAEGSFAAVGIDPASPGRCSACRMKDVRRAHWGL